MSMLDAYTISGADFNGEIEKVVTVFRCYCGYDDLEEHFEFCPSCGSKLVWDL